MIKTDKRNKDFSSVLWAFSLILLILAIIASAGADLYRNLSFWLFIDSIVFAIAAYYVQHKHNVKLEKNISSKTQIGLIFNIIGYISLIGIWLLSIYSNSNKSVNISNNIANQFQKFLGSNTLTDNIVSYIYENYILIDIIVLALFSLIIVIKSADKVVGSISSYAKKLGLSDYLIGFLIVSIGTSIPELITAITASLQSKSSGMLILGNVIGANIIDVTVIIGFMAIIGKKLKIESKILNKTIFLILAIAILPLLLSIDGLLGRTDGLIMLAFFGYYVFRLWRQEGKFGHIKKDVAWKHIYKDMIIFIISLLFLLQGAKYLVQAALQISVILDIPAYIVGLLVIAIGTTMPELSVGIRSVLRGHKDIGFGDIMGSVICNSSLVLGIAVLINPISIGAESLRMFLVGSSFMITAVFISILFLDKGKIT